MRFESLSTVAQIIMGQSPPSSSYNLRGQGLPFFQGKTDFGDLYPKARVFCTEPLKIAEAGDILISVRAPVGPTNINIEKSCIGRGLAALRCREGFDTKYLFYFLRFYEPRLALISTGSTFGAISRDDLENIRAPKLPLAEQKRIAAILEKADRLRRQHHYALDLSNSYLQSVFLEMFGDPVRNPKGWEQATLGDVIHSVHDGPHVSPNYTPRGVPFLSTRNIRPGEVLWDDLKFITHEDAKEHWKKCKPRRGDILYTKGGTTGLAKAIDFDREIAIWVHIALLKANHELVDPLWLESMLNSDFCYTQSQELTHGIANRDLGLNRMVKIRIYLPPLPQQQEFTRIAQKYKHLNAQQREAERQAEHLFQTLLHQAFEGNVGLGSGVVQDMSVEDSVEPSVRSQLKGTYVQLQMNY